MIVIKEDRMKITVKSSQIPRSLVLIVATIISVNLIPLTNLRADEHLSKKQSPHTRVQGDITVQLEKISVERIYNPAAWLKSATNGMKKDRAMEFVKMYESELPLKAISIYLSVTGETKQLGPCRIKFADPDKAKKIYVYSKFSSPPSWDKRVQMMEVDPKANGIQEYLLIPGDIQVSDLFPLDLEVSVTDLSNKEVKFIYEKVNF